MTDSKGFDNLLNKINSLHGSKIIFLTARTNDEANNNKFTRNHFKANIDLADCNEKYFIDDFESYIKTVKDIFPNIKCYKFKVKY